MRFKTTFALLVTLALSAPFGSEPAIAQQSKPPFERILILTGGGAQSAIHVGMLQALEDQGWRPDAVIGTCGGAIAASLALRFANAKDRLSYLESKDYFETLRAIQYPEATDIPKSIHKIISRMNLYKKEGLLTYPSNDEAIADIDFSSIQTGFNFPFASDKSPKVLIGASEFLFDPSQGSQALSQSLFREVYFTDPSTAQSIADIQSVQTNDGVQAIMNVAVSVAIRASIADPYAFEPIEINGKHYSGGGYQLNPTALALRLGKQVISTYNGPYNLLEIAAVSSAWGSDFGDRLAKAHSAPIYRWIDFTDRGDYPHLQFDPILDPVSGKIEQKLPEAFGDDFVKTVRAQWKWGYDRATESLATPEGSIDHLRKLDRTNTTAERLRDWKRRRALEKKKQ